MGENGFSCVLTSEATRLSSRFVQNCVDTSQRCAWLNWGWGHRTKQIDGKVRKLKRVEGVRAITM